MPTYLLDPTEFPPASFRKYGIFGFEIMRKTCWIHVHFILRIDFMCLCCVYFVKNCYLLRLQCFPLPFIRCDILGSYQKLNEICVLLHWIGNKHFIANKCDLILTLFTSLLLFASISHFSSLFTSSSFSVLTESVLNTTIFHSIC